MHRIPIYQVDAFTGAVFGGNPAAVCPLDEWLPDETLRAIAAENNLSETAFLIPDRDPVPLRWFTPRLEVKLCGHATLASAFVLFEFLEPGREAVKFETMSGRLGVKREDDRLSMDFPAIGSERLEPGDVPAALIDGLGAEPDEVRLTDDDWNYVAVFADAGTVVGLRPDFRLIEQVHPHGVAATGPGEAGAGKSGVDFVSRYFVPGYGIPEDPVTGSIHCALAPYWAGRLGRERLSARQVSERGGRLDLVVAGERVQIEGTAVTYMTGEIVVP